MPLPSTEQEARDKQVVEDFYNLLPLFMNLLYNDSALMEERIKELIRIRNSDRHLSIDALRSIDPDGLSKHVQRLIKRKRKNA